MFYTSRRAAVRNLSRNVVVALVFSIAFAMIISGLAL